MFIFPTIMSSQDRKKDGWTQSIFDALSRNGQADASRSWPQNHIEETATLGSKYRSSATIDTSYVQSPVQLTSESISFFSSPCRLMFTRFPYRDKSYIAGVLFTIGSAFLVANGFCTSVISPDTSLHRITLRYVMPIFNIVGTLFLWIGSSFAVFEAFNVLENEIILRREILDELRTNTMPKIEASVQTTDRNYPADTSSSGQLHRHALQSQEGDSSPRSNDTQTRSRLISFLRYPFDCSSVILLRVATLGTPLFPFFCNNFNRLRHKQKRVARFSSPLQPSFPSHSISHRPPMAIEYV